MGNPKGPVYKNQKFWDSGARNRYKAFKEHMTNGCFGPSGQGSGLRVSLRSSKLLLRNFN